MNRSVAILYQAKPAPAVNGIAKPMKPGGYRDSGADIACALHGRGVRVITRREYPRPAEDLDWVFADSIEGVRAAREAGADTLWLNTVLFAGHPALRAGAWLVGQPGELVERFDDKLLTNAWLRRQGLPMADSRAFDPGALPEFPFVVKPIRGRGSHGVRVVRAPEDLGAVEAGAMVEPYLAGEEITIAVMPAGDGHARPWCLPPVRRVGHVAGVAPYSGAVAVVENSVALDRREAAEGAVVAACEAAARAAGLMGIRAPIRIDARAGADGKYLLFDVNLKPNLTGPGRPGRERQDSLVSLAARAHGWSYGELVERTLQLAWRENLKNI